VLNYYSNRCPSDKCASAANWVRKSIDVL
jgi:hypothetical protein